MCVYNNGSCDCDSHSGSQVGGGGFLANEQADPLYSTSQSPAEPRESAASVGLEEVGRELEGRSAVTTLTSRMKMHFN